MKDRRKNNCHVDSVKQIKLIIDSNTLRSSIVPKLYCNITHDQLMLVNNLIDGLLSEQVLGGGE